MEMSVICVFPGLTAMKGAYIGNRKGQQHNELSVSLTYDSCDFPKSELN